MAITQAGVIVASVENGHVLAMVGSLKYGMKNKGFNNATLAKRSAGSTLKPFLYAHALEKGHQAFSEIPDTFQTYQTPFGDYLPHNADRRLYGPVTLRTALGNSLNISAVKLLRSVGIHPFYDVLKQVELVDNNSQKADYYGLGLAIGNMEVSLFQLVQGYSALANMGEYRPLSFIYTEPPQPEKVFSPETAYVISDILADPTARLLTFGNPDSLEFGFPVAIKTGTSSNYKDCWIIGYTPRHIVGVWAGNFNGAPNRGVAGSKVCGPILKEIMTYLYGDSPPGRFPRPPIVRQKLICWLSGKPASTTCPYTYPELAIGPTTSFEKCSLTHKNDQFLYLGAHYARWIHQREKEQGLARFRLERPNRAVRRMEEHIEAQELIRKKVGPIMGTTRVTITTPHDFDRFVLSPHNPNRIRFRAIADPLAPHITWLIDGKEIERTPPPYEFLWEPTRGRHRIHAITPHGQAAEVIIDVE
jgi:penicillin-binding protein 1C